MKKFATILVAVGMFAAAPAMAAHEAEGDPSKDHVTECVIQADSIQKKIARIQDEIKKGSKQYSEEDLKKLNQKLKEANETLDALTKP